jgi:hypothetical protein
MAMFMWWLENWEKIIAVVGFVLGVIGVYFGLKGVEAQNTVLGDSQQ